MSILLEGNADEIQRWGLLQAKEAVSCREVFTGASPRKAREFASVALEIVHRACAEIVAETDPSEMERIYLTKHLHDAVSTAPTSAWVALVDDARAVMALEIAQRCLSTPFLVQKATALPILETMKRLRVTSTQQRLPASSTRLMSYLEGAVLEDLAAESLHDEYVIKLQRLQSGFGLSTQELTRLLRVSRTAIQKWLSGGGMSRDAQARIDENLDTLARMESYWRPGLLPSIVRRHGRGLKGKTPLQLILRGGADTVLDYFDALTDYAATA